MAVSLFRATWVSDELAGASKPNIASYYAADEAHGYAVATALDALISGDFTSCNVQIAGSQDRTTYPAAAGGTENLVVQDADGFSEHFSFRGVHFGVRAALLGYVLNNPGSLKLYHKGTAVTDVLGASR